MIGEVKWNGSWLKGIAFRTHTLSKSAWIALTKMRFDTTDIKLRASTKLLKIVCSLLTTIVQQPALSSVQFLSYRLGFIYCFAGNTKSVPPRSPGLLIQIWSRGGEGAFYRRSHNQILGLVPTDPDIGWCMIPKDNLSDEGAQVILFPEGGL